MTPLRFLALCALTFLIVFAFVAFGLLMEEWTS